MCYSFKKELMQTGHNFTGVQTLTANTHTTTTLDGLPSTANLCVGMAVANSGGTPDIAAGTVIAAIASSSSVTLSIAATGTHTGQTYTFTADTFKILLIKSGPARTFDGSQTNVGTPGTGTPSATNVGTDETSGTGYTTGGNALTNVTPSLAGTSVAITDFTPDPSWTSSTFSTTAAVIYNASVRIGDPNGITANASGSAINRAVSVHDFGGTQSVSGGTLTAVMPTPDQTNAILRVS
jgi:hypothetical protein